MRAFGAEIAGLIITGDTAPARLAEAQSAGFVLLHKPVTGEALHRAVMVALNGPAARNRP